MKKSVIALFALCSCGSPSEEFPPFIAVALEDPEGFTSPAMDTLQVTTSAVLNGSATVDTFEIPLGENTLPTDFVIRFSEQVRGQNVDIGVVGLSSGVDVLSASGSATAGSATIALTVEFCGDEATSAGRDEQCDDGAGNSDITPNACRSECILPSCGDAVLDQGEACDDGASNSDVIADACRLDCSLPTCGDGAVDTGEACDDGDNINADGCEADCTLPACGNDILDPEDFEGSLCYIEDTPAGFTSNSLDIEVADMDGDGFQDVIFGEDVAVRIAFGDGTGGFSEIRTIGTLTNGNTSSLSIVNISGGGLDIISSSPLTNEISIFTNINQRNFSKSILQNFDTPTDHIAGDFDSDGRIDLIISEATNNLLFVRGLNSGFAAPVTVAGFTRTDTVVGLEVDDINNDNNIDFIITESINNNNDTKLSVARGNGGGGFSFSSVTLSGISVNSVLFVLPNNVTIFDQDGDSNKEIFLIDLDSPRTATVETINSSVNNAVVSFANLSKNFDGINTADIDNDLLDDILLINGPVDISILLSSRNYEEVDLGLSLSSSLDVIVAGQLNQDNTRHIISNENIFVFEE